MFCTPQEYPWRPHCRLLSYFIVYHSQSPFPSPSPSPSPSHPPSPSPSPSPPSQTPPAKSITIPSPGSGSGSGRLFIGALISALITLVMTTLFFIGVIYYLRRRKKHSTKRPRQGDSLLPSSMTFHPHSLGTFTYEELELATDGFSESNFLGQGGFGTVHKGVLSGKTVAVKQQKSGSKQGMQEFQTEVQVISRVHHRHLVSLVGYCIAKAQMTLMLVYEFVPNKALDFHLHGKRTETLDWSTRMKIAYGSAKGLAYLHEDCEPKIIHRDVKAANILLNNNFEPKIADFGLAKLSSDTETHVSTAKVKGTFGYLAPEYANSGRLSEKSDVFSFGVVLLELITGRKHVLQTGSFSDDYLVEWARPLLNTALENRNFEVLADARLQNDYDSEEMFRMASCAANCVIHSHNCRPRMSQVVDALGGKISLANWKDGSTQVDMNQIWNESLSEYSESTLSSIRQNTANEAC